MEATVYRPGEGLRLTARGSEMLFKATAESGHGGFSFMERTVPPGGRRPPRHAHVAADEAFYVLDGELTFFLGDDVTTGGAGSFVFVPGGVMHSFGNASAADARVLILHAPAMDGYFRELHELWADPAAPPSRDAERELMSRHGMRPEGGQQGTESAQGSPGAVLGGGNG